MISSVEDYHEGTKIFNQQITLINEFKNNVKYSTVKKSNQYDCYFVDLYSHRGIESRTMYKELELAKLIAEEWVLTE